MEQPLTPRNREAAETIGRVLAPRGVSQRKIHPCSARIGPRRTTYSPSSIGVRYVLKVSRSLPQLPHHKPDSERTPHQRSKLRQLSSTTVPVKFTQLGRSLLPQARLAERYPGSGGLLGAMVRTVSPDGAGIRASCITTRTRGPVGEG